MQEISMRLCSPDQCLVSRFVCAWCCKLCSGDREKRGLRWADLWTCFRAVVHCVLRVQHGISDGCICDTGIHSTVLSLQQRRWIFYHTTNFCWFNIMIWYGEMVEVGTGWCECSGAQPGGQCLLLLIFPCTIKSRSSFLALAQQGGPGKGP